MSVFVKIGAHHVRPAEVSAVSVGASLGGVSTTHILMRSGETLNTTVPLEDVLALIDPEPESKATMHWGSQP